jgi:hypothetical protein
MDSSTPAGSRATGTGLTERGRATVREVMRRRRAQISRIVSRMAATARRNLVRALSAFATAGGASPDGEASIVWL